MSNWKAGDKALCVDASPNPTSVEHDPISVGSIYLVTDVHEFLGFIGLSLAGLDPGYGLIGKRVGYKASRFRKIVPACDRVAIEQEQEATP